MNIRRNDIVAVQRGRDRGKQGKVLHVDAKTGRAVVEGVNMATKHVRKGQDNPQGGIVRKEASIAVANLMLFCAPCKKAVRARRAVEDGKRVRKCKRCGQAFDA